MQYSVDSLLSEQIIDGSRLTIDELHLIDQVGNTIQLGRGPSQNKQSVLIWIKYPDQTASEISTCTRDQDSFQDCRDRKVLSDIASKRHIKETGWK